MLPPPRVGGGVWGAEEEEAERLRNGASPNREAGVTAKPETVLRSAHLVCPPDYARENVRKTWPSTPPSHPQWPRLMTQHRHRHHASSRSPRTWPPLRSGSSSAACHRGLPPQLTASSRCCCVPSQAAGQGVRFDGGGEGSGGPRPPLHHLLTRARWAELCHGAGWT